MPDEYFQITYLKYYELIFFYPGGGLKKTHPCYLYRLGKPTCYRLCKGTKRWFTFTRSGKKLPTLF